MNQAFLRNVLGLLSMGLIWAEPVLGENQRVVARELQQRCNPIGRITEGSGSSLRQGDIICLGQRIENRQSAKMLCFASSREVLLPPGTTTVDRSLCGGTPGGTQTRACNSDQTQCFYPKGSSVQAAFQILHPNGVLTTAVPVNIAWEPVGDADRYQISLSGPDLHWEQVSQNTSLTYPASAPPLRLGNAYQIVVSAVAADGTLLGTASTVVNVAGEAAHLQLQTSVPRAQSEPAAN